jgi:hypothetical protein
MIDRRNMLGGQANTLPAGLADIVAAARGEGRPAAAHVTEVGFWPKENISFTGIDLAEPGSDKTVIMVTKVPAKTFFYFTPSRQGGKSWFREMYERGKSDAKLRNNW